MSIRKRGNSYQVIYRCLAKLPPRTENLQIRRRGPDPGYADQIGKKEWDF